VRRLFLTDGMAAHLCHDRIDSGAALCHARSAKLAKRFEADESINDFVLRLDVVPWAASSAYGDLRAQLESSGTPIGNLDTLIAAHALHHEYVLVTNNVKHFKRVPKLKIDNWARIRAISICKSLFHILSFKTLSKTQYIQS